MLRIFPRIRVSVACGVATALLFAVTGCQLAARRSGPGDTASADSLAALTKRIAALEKQVARRDAEILNLSAEVAERKETTRLLQEEVDRTSDLLDYAERQFISLEKGLQERETKATAVTAIAEAQMAYDGRVRTDGASVRHPSLRHAHEMIQRADDMLARSQYAATVYFAKRAIRLVEESMFDSHSLVRIVSVQRANLRSGPGLDFDVVGKLSKGAVLREVEQQTPWFYVETKQGQRGWIHQTVTMNR